MAGNRDERETRSGSGRRIYIASEGFAGEINGKPFIATKNVTRVAEGHPALKLFGAYFRPIDADYEIEEMTAAPGAKRGEPA